MPKPPVRALSASRLIVTKDLAQCVEIPTSTARSTLIIQTRNARELVDGITSAGSVFLGDWSPESAGDYASGTKPRSADLRLHRHLFQPRAGGFPEAHDRAGTVESRFSALASTIETLAAAERLTAHKNAVTLRVNALKEQA